MTPETSVLPDRAAPPRVQSYEEHARFRLVEIPDRYNSPAPTRWFPWLCLAWIALGTAIALRVRATRPQSWNTMGAIFETE
jgi:hypothetical protein